MFFILKILILFIHCAISYEINSKLLVNSKESIICSSRCPKILLPVCGYNGKLYKIFQNDCLFQVTKCKDEIEWNMVDMMYCDDDDNLQNNLQNEKYINKINNCLQNCSATVLNPICAFNNDRRYKIFLNECEFSKANNCKETATEDREKWHQTSIENCNDDVIFKSTVEDKVNCIKPCLHIYFPVCGFDGKVYRTFSNKCMFEVTNCEEKYRWIRVPYSVCETHQNNLIN